MRNVSSREFTYCKSSWGGFCRACPTDFASRQNIVRSFSSDALKTTLRQILNLTAQYFPERRHHTTSTETMSDKIKRMLKNEVQQM